MLRKMIMFILCLSMMASNITIEAKAVEYERKELVIKKLNDGEVKTYEVVTDGKEVYISVDDLTEIVGFDEKMVDVANDTINQITLTKDADYNGFNQDIQIFPKKKIIYSAWYGEQEFDGCLKLEEEAYLNIVDIFNYLRVKAEVVEGQLLINIPVYTLLDFMVYDYKEVLNNSVSQLDLLKADESSFSSGLFDALSLACNNFDLKLLIPIAGAEHLKSEQYMKALQTLNEEDTVFYDENTDEYMREQLEERGFKGVLASGEDLLNVMSIGGSTIETTDTVISNLEGVPSEELQKYVDLINWNDETYSSVQELKEWKKKADKASKVLEAANMVVSAYETYVRAESWNQECLEDLESLQNLDVENYGNHKKYVQRIKSAAEKCYKESENKIGAVGRQTAYDLGSLILEEVIKAVPVYGKVADYFVLTVNTGISVAKCFGNVADEMDKAELSYMVTCLINVAAASRINTEVEYSKLNRLDMHSGEIDSFRNSMKTTIKSNLRCWSYIYYLNNDKAAKEKVDKMNMYLTLLKESEQYDYALDEYDLITYSPERIVEILDGSDLTKEGNYETVLAEYKMLAENDFDSSLAEKTKYVNEGVWNYSGQDIYSVYYRYEDLSGDGESELIISINENEAPKNIIDIFGMENGKLVRIIESNESVGYRSQYYITTDNRIKMKGSGGAMDTEVEYYRLSKNDISLELEEKYVYNGWEGDTYTHIDNNNVSTSISKEKYMYFASAEDVDFESEW